LQKIVPSAFCYNKKEKINIYLCAKDCPFVAGKGVFPGIAIFKKIERKGSFRGRKAMKRISLLLAVTSCILLSFSAAFGQPLNGSEAQPGENNLQSALEYNKTNQPTNWVNPDTGETGSIVPVKTFKNSEGQYCREFRQTILIGGKKEQGYGTACRQPDGTWQIVRGEGDHPTAYSQAPPVEKKTYGNVYGPPYVYGYYPYYPYRYYPYRYYPYYPPAYYYYPYPGPYYYYYPYYSYYPYGLSFSFGYFYSNYGGHHSGGHHSYHGHSGHGGNYGHYNKSPSWGHGGSHGRGGHSSGGSQWQGRRGHR
jgi:surface antigen